MLGCATIVFLLALVFGVGEMLFGLVEMVIEAIDEGELPFGGDGSFKFLMGMSLAALGGGVGYLAIGHDAMMGMLLLAVAAGAGYLFIKSHS